MKFSQKMFTVSFALMILSMYVLGGWMMNDHHKANVEAEVSRCTAENKIILSTVAELAAKQSSEEAMTAAVSAFVSKMSGSSDTSIAEVDKNGQAIYRNSSQTLYKPAPLANLQTSIGALIFDRDAKTVLTTYSKVEAGGALYAVYTEHDVTPLYTARSQQIVSFIKISTLLTLLCALVLAVMIYFMTKKIRDLELEAEKVCLGDYSGEIRIKGNDEIADLSKQFNAMISSVSQNMEQIRRVSENRKLFVADLTHEIKSPLTSIIGYAELLKNVKLTDEERMQKYAGKIHEDGKYIEQLSESLTQVILLDNHTPDKTMANFSELLKTTLSMAQDMFAGFRIPIEAAVKPGIQKAINPSLIQSLILNLLKNACKASPADSKITVLLNEERLSVTDRGKGIPLEELERIREPFYQVDNQARSRQENRGLGLGLPLCIRIAEIHGWQLIIQSKVGHGTAITIFFNKDESYEEI